MVDRLRTKPVLAGSDGDWECQTRLMSMLLYSDSYPFACVNLHKADVEVERLALRHLQRTCETLNAAAKPGVA
eukprot:1281777-Amphidinium_carterae.1